MKKKLKAWVVISKKTGAIKYWKDAIKLGGDVNSIGQKINTFKCL